MNSPMSSLQAAFSRCRSGLAAVGAFSLVINLLVLTTSIYMLQVYDRVLSSQSVSTLVFLTLLAGGALLLMGFFELVRSRILVRVGTWLDRLLSPTVLARGLDNAVQGRPYTTEALRDLGTVRSFLGGAGILSLFDAPWVPIYLAFVYLLHPTLGHVALAGAVVLIVLALLTHASTAGMLARAGGAAGAGMRSADAAFRNAEAVDGLGMAGTLTRRWDAVNAEVLEMQRVASDRAGLINAATKTVRMFLQIAILGTGAWLVLQSELSPGAMIAASIIMGRALAPVEQAIGTWKHTVAARDSWRRLKGLLGAAPLHPPAMPLPRPKGIVSIQNVCYAPAGAAEMVLRGITLHATPGEALAIIGPSAAGKSTLARLMVGMASPRSGAVRLDDAEIGKYDRADFGRFVGYLPQDVELFPGTVRENIARMEEGDPAEVVKAARLAGVHEMILRLPDGYETQIGERGAVLSGGQRQRIGLARAVYGSPALVVLDEPNSNLDAVGEEALNGAIAGLKAAGSTVVLIAHRPSLMAHVDRIAVLNEGQVKTFGERNAVLAQLRGVPAAGQPQVQVVKT